MHKEEIYPHLLLINRQSIELCEMLCTCLTEEREALILLKTDSISEITAHKEQLYRQVRDSRRVFNDFAFRELNAKSFSELILLAPPSRTEELKVASASWEKIWIRTHQLCESNQKFLRHSLRNLGLLVDHWKRLFGERPLYSAKGRKVETQQPGKVIEATY